MRQQNLYNIHIQYATKFGYRIGQEKKFVAEKKIKSSFNLHLVRYAQFRAIRDTQADKKIRMARDCGCGLSTIIEHMYEIYSQVQKSIEIEKISVKKKVRLGTPLPLPPRAHTHTVRLSHMLSKLHSIRKLIIQQHKENESRFSGSECEKNRIIGNK